MTAPLPQFSPVLLDLEAAQEMTRVAVDAVTVRNRAGVVIGAVGVGGGSPQQDHDVAAAAVTACPA